MKLSPVSQVKRLTRFRNDKKVITEFANAYGLVYFGFVSQTDDEHRIVRGLTVSTNHRDEHYCIGSYEGYDVVFVERSDQLKSKHSGNHKTHRWHIFEFDLQTTRDLPHVFVGLPTHSEEFYQHVFTKFANFRALTLGNTAHYPQEFTTHHTVYANPADTIELETLIPPATAALIAQHCKGLAFEIIESSLFIYAEHGRVTSQLLEAMIKNGRWLAETIDNAATISPSGEVA